MVKSADREGVCYAIERVSCNQEGVFMSADRESVVKSMDQEGVCYAMD